MELLLALFIKHFIVDFPLQAHPYLYIHKGEYGHPGGVIHSFLHAVGTAFCVGVVFILQSKSQAELTYYALVLGFLDGIIHYHIDWAKMNLNRIFNLKPDNSEWFWILVGFDQLLHHLTYFGLIYMV